MPSSYKEILQAATECFLQHGYSAANISMISRYSGFSRVTVHKLFTSKEQLFKAVVAAQFEKFAEYRQGYSQSTNDFWTETQELIIYQCKDLFEDVTSNLVRADLLHAGQAYCQDIIGADELAYKETVIQRLKNEISAERLSLDKVGMTIYEFVDAIKHAPFGITVSVIEEDTIHYIKNLIKIFRAATLPNPP